MSTWEGVFCGQVTGDVCPQKEGGVVWVLLMPQCPISCTAHTLGAASEYTTCSLISGVFRLHKGFWFAPISTCGWSQCMGGSPFLFFRL